MFDNDRFEYQGARVGIVVATGSSAGLVKEFVKSLELLEHEVIHGDSMLTLQHMIRDHITDYTGKAADIDINPGDQVVYDSAGSIKHGDYEVVPAKRIFAREG